MLFNHIRTYFCRSSHSLFKYALQEPHKNIPIAIKLISAKNRQAHENLYKSYLNPQKQQKLNDKIEKYNLLLDKLCFIYNPEISIKCDLNNNENHKVKQKNSYISFYSDDDYSPYDLINLNIEQTKL